MQNTMRVFSIYVFQYVYFYLGTGHYLWLGEGSGSKVGRPRKFLEGYRVGIEKILRSLEWASKYFFAGVASFVKSHT